MNHSLTATPENYLNHEKGLWSWLTTKDHKRIGLLYLYSIMVFFSTAAVLGLLMRIEKFAPGATIMTAQTYNAMFSIHGIIMIFVIVIPGLSAVFGNFFLPIMIGAKDVAFPRLNLFTWYLYIIGSLVALYSQFANGNSPDAGWTFYVPYSAVSDSNMVLALSGAFILGFASILTGLNFVVTIHQMRAPGMTWFKMPLFPWSLYATAWIQLLASPIIGITLLMVIAERVLQIGFFDPSLGGDPLLYQHLFWIYSHPAVYVMILPAMGVVTEIFPTFSQKPVFGYKAIAISSLAIALIGYFVWGHHMFTSGMSYYSRIFFSLLTFLVAIPSAIKVFNWLGTLYGGSIDLKPPLLYSLSFILLFIIGGFSGLTQGALATNVHITDTDFIVAHFHYIVFGGMGFGFLAAIHYWFPKIYGRIYSFRFANIAWAFIFTGFNCLYFPMFILGLEGMPRRYFDYVPRYTSLQEISTVGAFIMIIGFILMISNLIYHRFNGAIASANPWHGVTLEWQIPSPPPEENFEEIPVITDQPYTFKHPVTN